MKIPKSFKLFSSVFTVKWDNQKMNDQNIYGICNYSKKEIILSDLDGIDTISEDTRIDTFYHERTHAILDSMGEHDLSKNEKFVDIFSKLLRQADETAKY